MIPEKVEKQNILQLCKLRLWSIIINKSSDTGLNSVIKEMFPMS